jgi:MFS family permease
VSTSRIKPGERRLLLLPTFADALATTVATTYLPVLAHDFTSNSTVIAPQHSGARTIAGATRTLITGLLSIPVLDRLRDRT